MKLINNTETKKLHQMLENLEIPKVQLPAHREHLREMLLASVLAGTESISLSPWQKFRAKFVSRRSFAWKLAASMAVLFLALGIFRIYFIAPLPVASVALQVNPAVVMTISAGNNVISAEGLDEQGRALLAGLDIKGKELQEALRLIANSLREAGMLDAGRRILVALLPVGERLGAAEMDALTGSVHQTLDMYLAEHRLPVMVVSSKVTAELGSIAYASGLLPADYVDLVAAVGSPLAMQVLMLPKKPGFEPARYREELDDISEAIIELAAEGLSKVEVQARVKQAIGAAPFLEDFDDLLELPDDETDAVKNNREGRNDRRNRGTRDKQDTRDERGTDLDQEGEREDETNEAAGTARERRKAGEDGQGRPEKPAGEADQAGRAGRTERTGGGGEGREDEVEEPYEDG